MAATIKPELIIFDMDGLMLDTEPISKKGWQIAGEQMGVDIGDDVFYRLLGCGVDAAQRIMREAYGEAFDYDKASEIRKQFTHDYIRDHGAPVKKGLYELLDALDDLGIKKSVATSTRSEGATLCLGGADVYGRFDAVITGDMVTRGKPDPEIFLTAARILNTPPEHCLVLEDSLVGVQAAANAGIPVVIVPDIIKPDVETVGRAFAVCESLLDVIKLIR